MLGSTTPEEHFIDGALTYDNCGTMVGSPLPLAPMTRIATALVVAAGLVACSHPTISSEPPIGDLGTPVLFVGNSLTYTNDMPAMVAAIARSAGTRLDARQLTAPDRALIDFVIDGSASQVILGARWAYVVMQQGPTTVPICRDTLVMAVRQMSALTRQVGGRPLVVMSWPRTSRSGDFPKVHESAHMAANDVGGAFAPAGDAWQLALQDDPQLPLYGFDGYHPAPLGSLLAALVIYEQVTGADARTLPANAATLAGFSTLDAATFRKLQNAAHAANVRAATIVVPTWTPATPPSPTITC